MPTQRDIEALVPMVRRLVARHFRNVPDHIAGQDDLVQAGMERILRAALRWTEDGDSSFAGWSYQQAWYGIADFIRDNNFGKRRFRDFTLLSLETPVSTSENGDPVTLGATLSTEDDYVDPYVLDGIGEALSKCSLDAQSAFALHIEEEMPLRDVGEMLGVTESRASQLVKYARDAIATHPAVDVERRRRGVPLAA